jgi:AhpD family alkylhydroperoxidase
MCDESDGQGVEALDERTRVLVRLRVAALTECEALLAAEKARALAAGIGPDEIEPACQGRAEADEDYACLVLTSKLVRDSGRHLAFVRDTATRLGVSCAKQRAIAHAAGEALTTVFIARLS